MDDVLELHWTDGDLSGTEAAVGLVLVCWGRIKVAEGGLRLDGRLPISGLRERGDYDKRGAFPGSLAQEQTCPEWPSRTVLPLRDHCGTH